MKKYKHFAYLKLEMYLFAQDINMGFAIHANKHKNLFYITDFIFCVNYCSIKMNYHTFIIHNVI